MKTKFLDILSRHQILLSSAIIATVIVGGAGAYYKNLELTAALNSSCPLQSDIDNKTAERAQMASDLTVASSAKLSLLAEIPKASMEYASITDAIPKIEKAILSDYALLQEKKKTDDITARYNAEKVLADFATSIKSYTDAKASITLQLPERKSLDGLLAATDSAQKSYAAASTAFYAAKPKAGNYNALQSAYNTALASLNAASAKSGAALRAYNQKYPSNFGETYAQLSADLALDTSQITNLVARYNSTLAAYKSKYLITPGVFSDTEAAYKNALNAYNSLVAKNQAAKDYANSLRAMLPELKNYRDVVLPQKIVDAGNQIVSIQSAIATADYFLKQASMCVPDNTPAYVDTSAPAEQVPADEPTVSDSNVNAGEGDANTEEPNMYDNNTCDPGEEKIIDGLYMYCKKTTPECDYTLLESDSKKFENLKADHDLHLNTYRKLALQLSDLKAAKADLAKAIEGGSGDVQSGAASVSAKMIDLDSAIDETTNNMGILQVAIEQDEYDMQALSEKNNNCFVLPTRLRDIPEAFLKR
ncbi:MAG: hypothetical protein V4438_02595 [Patescibacteria group bacterium]